MRCRSNVDVNSGTPRIARSGVILTLIVVSAVTQLPLAELRVAVLHLPGLILFVEFEVGVQYALCQGF